MRLRHGRGCASSRQETTIMCITPNASIRIAFQNHALFGALSAGELTELLQSGRLVRYRRGQSIFAKGAPGRALIAIVSGTVRISNISADGREITYALLSDGEMFGEMSVLDGGNRSAHAIAETDCRLLSLGRGAFLDFIGGHPDVALRLLAILSQRLRRKDEQLEEILFGNLRSRLAKRLLEMAAASGTRLGAGIRIAESLSPSGIASRLGSARESVSRQLNTWRKQGVVRAENDATILDVDALREIAGHADP
jgi:CRP-like cAMP-binding protein